MPAYEIAVIIRSGLNRPELKDAVKRVCSQLHDKGGVISSMENLGEKALPMVVRKDLKKYEYGNYFFLQCKLPAHNKFALGQVYKADVDILNYQIMNDVKEAPRPCLYRPCLFGEVVKPKYDRSLYKTNTLRKLKNRKVLS